MAHYDLHTDELKSAAPRLRAGDTVTLTGTLYTARDAAHKRIVAAMDAGEPLPFDLNGAAIYYAGPTPAKPGQVIGSVGPTTSGRMDPFAPKLLDAGLTCMIGKGVRSQPVADAMARTGGVYMVAIGGAGAVKAESIKGLEVIAYDDLGCESVKRLTVDGFTAIVAMDCVGGNLYRDGAAQYRREEKEETQPEPVRRMRRIL
ncbi:MAG: FumA C-terminus/TtdB family hydratase beta subunit [Butyricicoccus sp.]|nr:fumarate hydratase C-terminal domain-containing protein [Butyricicoccus pullicaecorum]MCI6720704.1 FumA C-terminus/TtdB family hydratase beta subunit [Clostridiales bacterium]MDY5971325.1 FumA C-terminus/TtdB family hydratase beta subunit [Butyricicoccus sp.]